MVQTDYVSGKEGGRRFVDSEDCVNALIQKLDEDYIKKNEERRITVTASINIGDIRIKENLKEAEKRRKTTGMIFQARNWSDYIREYINMATKRKL